MKKTLILALLILGALVVGAQANECTTCDVNLTGYWSFDTDTRDDYRQLHNGTIIGTSNFSTGIVGNGFSFNSNTYIQVKNHSDFNIKASGWSLSFWVKTPSADQPNANAGVVRTANSGSQGFLTRIDQNNIDARLFAPEVVVISANSGTINDSTWHHYVLTYNGVNAKLYRDNETTPDIISTSGTGNSVNDLEFGRDGTVEGGIRKLQGMLDEIGLWNRTINESEIRALYADYKNGLSPLSGGGGPSNPPVLSGYNCTNCNDGDTTSPFSTDETTPTFAFTTNIAADCRIGDEDHNFTTMGINRSCTSGDGTTSHVCTLTSQDELISSIDYVYIGCKGTSNGLENATSSSGPLQIDLTDLNTTIGDAIELGITQSTINPATIYSNQLVYLRHINGSQVKATVDKVAVKGSQRWFFNVAINNEQPAGLFNITPAVYVYDVVNISKTVVTSQVSALINATKI